MTMGTSAWRVTAAAATVLGSAALPCSHPTQLRLAPTPHQPLRPPPRSLARLHPQAPSLKFATLPLSAHLVIFLPITLAKYPCHLPLLACQLASHHSTMPAKHSFACFSCKRVSYGSSMVRIITATNHHASLFFRRRSVKFWTVRFSVLSWKVANPALLCSAMCACACTLLLDMCCCSLIGHATNCTQNGHHNMVPAFVHTDGKPHGSTSYSYAMCLLCQSRLPVRNY